jgi:hypothetical protein
MKRVRLLATLAILSVAGCTAGAGPSPSRDPQLSVQATGSLQTPRNEATVVGLDDGRVLVAGGQSGDTGLSALDSAELFDPTTAQFVPTGRMVVARFAAPAVALADGKVLVAGGDTGNGQPTTDAEIFDPNTKRFAPTGSLLTARTDPLAVLLPDGRALVIGGALGDDATSVEAYDPSAGSFRALGRFPDWRTEYAVAVLPSGSLLMLGGRNAEGDPLASAEVLNPKSGKVTAVGDLVTARYGATATSLEDGRVLVAGGVGRDGPLASVEVFDPATDGFRPSGSLTFPRSFGNAIRFSANRVLLVGGSSNTSVELFDASTGTVEATAQFGGASRPGVAMTSNGAALIVGGDSFHGIDAPEGASSGAFLCRL